MKRVYPEGTNYNYPYKSYGTTYDYKYMKKEYHNTILEYYDHDDRTFFIRLEVISEKDIFIDFYEQMNESGGLLSKVMSISTSYEGFLEMTRYGKQLGIPYPTICGDNDVPEKNITPRSLESKRLLREIDGWVMDKYISFEDMLLDEWRDKDWNHYLDNISEREIEWIITHAAKGEYDSALSYCINTINLLKFVAYHLKEETKKDNKVKELT